MDQALQIYETKLIKTWQRKHDENIALYFFNKYKDEMLEIIYSKINNKFSSVPLEKGDLFYSVWSAILSCLKNYDTNKKGNFKTMVFHYAYCNCVREAVKFLKNSHIILNTAYSYEHLLEINKNFDFGKNSKVYVEDSYSEARKKFIDEVVEFNKLYKIDFLKKVIYLKSIGKTIKEIAKSTRKKVYQIKEVLAYICKITKKLYD